jgi:uncharacterized protein (TIGR02145 family)
MKIKKILLIFTCIALFSCSNDEAENNQTLPILTTENTSNITLTTATSGGNITSDGGADITARGLVWNTSSNPTISLATKTTDGTGIGLFTSNLTNLTPNTTYYFRAYATNSVGTAYGNEVTFTTLENEPLPSVTIGTQIWSSRNLDVTTYRDGTPIPQVTDPTQWANLTTGAWCYINNDQSNGAIYGKLYNWYAVAGIHDVASLNDPSLRKHLAPQGWHVPSYSEWTTLIDFLGGESLAGGKMKSTGTVQAGTGLWNDPNTSATNDSGFSGIPAGYRVANGSSFTFIGNRGNWWSSTQGTTSNAWLCFLEYDDSVATKIAVSKGLGISVRCIRD